LKKGRATEVKAVCMIYAIALALNMTALGLLGWNY
jgi:hypothetical protein